MSTIVSLLCVSSSHEMRRNSGLKDWGKVQILTEKIIWKDYSQCLLNYRTGAEKKK